jgi:hypothetical protein
MQSLPIAKKSKNEDDSNNFIVKLLETISKQNEELTKEVKRLNEKVSKLEDKEFNEIKFEHLFNRLMKEKFSEANLMTSMSPRPKSPKINHENINEMCDIFNDYIVRFEGYNQSIANILVSKNKKITYFMKVIDEINRVSSGNYCRVKIINLFDIFEKQNIEIELAPNILQIVKTLGDKGLENFIYVEKSSISKDFINVYIYF